MIAIGNYVVEDQGLGGFCGIRFPFNRQKREACQAAASERKEARQERRAERREARASSAMEQLAAMGGKGPNVWVILGGIAAVSLGAYFIFRKKKKE